MNSDYNLFNRHFQSRENQQILHQQFKEIDSILNENAPINQPWPHDRYPNDDNEAPERIIDTTSPQYRQVQRLLDGNRGT